MNPEKFGPQEVANASLAVAATIRSMHAGVTVMEIPDDVDPAAMIAAAVALAHRSVELLAAGRPGAFEALLDAYVIDALRPTTEEAP